MSTALPFSVPSRLPKKITPCPILEAVMEIRFVPNRPWDHFPGLFAEKFGKKYSKEEDTGILQIPQVVRDSDQALVNLPYRRLVGEYFTLQAGPRVVGLVTRRNTYPGWDSFWPAMAEVMAGLKDMGIIRETVRLGLRYINFFSFDIFDQLALSMAIGNQPLKNPETGFSTVLVQGPYRHLVQINNSAMVIGPDSKPNKGSILDVDTSFAARMPDLFGQAEAVFREAHVAEKSVFFGLLKPSFVDTLNPVY